MTEQELNALERIWKGETSWPLEWEKTLESLEASGYIEVIEKRRATNAGGQVVVTIFVKITDEGSANLSSSGY